MIALSISLAACSDKAVASSLENTVPTLASVNAEHIANVANTPESWLGYGGTYDEQRFSQIKTMKC